MRRLTLVEYQTYSNVPLSGLERDTLQRMVPEMAIAPSSTEREDGKQRTFRRSGRARYDLTPGSWIGAVQIGGLAVEIRPKLPIDRVLFLLSYSLDKIDWLEGDFAYGEASSLVEAMSLVFAGQVRRTIKRGLLQRYRSTEASLPAVRGRLRFDAQLRQRLGRYPPVEVRHDDLTEDVEENRLLKTALCHLLQLPLGSPVAVRRLRELERSVNHVSQIHPAHLPEIHYTASNEHYRPAIELAELILRSSSVELKHGQSPAGALLLDMNNVFETFVVVALRRALGLSEHDFPQGLGVPASNGIGARRLSLDEADLVGLKPDLSWWEAARCRFVGDVKYRRVGAAGIDHPDLYQLLAYAIAAGLPGGLLVYAAGEAEPVTHVVARANKELHVAALDLAGSPADILRQVDALAGCVRRLRASARRHDRFRPAIVLTQKEEP